MILHGQVAQAASKLISGEMSHISELWPSCQPRNLQRFLFLKQRLAINLCQSTVKFFRSSVIPRIVHLEVTKLTLPDSKAISSWWFQLI